MAFETLANTLKSAGLDEATVSALIANPTAAQQVNGWFEGGLRQSDYDRKMNADKAALASKESELEATRVRMNEQFMTAQQQRELAESRLATALAKARTAGNVYGVTDLEKEIFGDTPVTTAPVTTAPATGAPSDFDKRIGLVEDLFRTSTNMNVRLMDMTERHKALFPDKPLTSYAFRTPEGKEMRGVEAILHEAVTLRQDPIQVWDNRFGASAKEQQMHDDALRLEGATVREAELVKKFSGQTVNALNPSVPTSPIFNLPRKAATGNLPRPGDRNQREAETVANAASAFMSGKYRTQAQAPQR